jgi:ABC-type sulfate transport system permease component
MENSIANRLVQMWSPFEAASKQKLDCGMSLLVACLEVIEDAAPSAMAGVEKKQLALRVLEQLVDRPQNFPKPVVAFLLTMLNNPEVLSSTIDTVVLACKGGVRVNKRRWLNVVSSCCK